MFNTNSKYKPKRREVIVRYNILNEGVLVTEKLPSAEDVESILKTLPGYQRFLMVAELPVSFKAYRLRTAELGQKLFRLYTETGKAFDIFRSQDDTTWTADLSGMVLDDEFPVINFNIKFRDFSDPLTERGIVWVMPGEPAKMYFWLNAEALEMPGMAGEIAAAAEKAVQENILAYFSSASVQ